MERCQKILWYDATKMLGYRVVRKFNAKVF